LIATYWKHNEIKDAFEIVDLIKSKLDVMIVGTQVFFSRPVLSILDDILQGNEYSEKLTDTERNEITHLSQKYIHRGVEKKNI
jgi:hypothetical protein